MSRIAEHPIEPFLLQRWSGRAFSGEPIDDPEALRLFEAAKWAPSWGNSQPWRFVWCRQGTPAFTALFGALVPGNQEWATRAGGLILVSSIPARPDGRNLPTHAFDTGAAWMSLALQASAMGLVCHAMGGFDAEKARVACRVPSHLAVHCVVAVGKPGDPALLSEQKRAMEKPNTRDPVDQHVVIGAFAP